MCNYVCNIITCTLFLVHAQGSHRGTGMKTMHCFANLKAWSHNSTRFMFCTRQLSGFCWQLLRSDLSTTALQQQHVLRGVLSPYNLCCHPTTDGSQLCLGWGTLSSDRTALHLKSSSKGIFAGLPNWQGSVGDWPWAERVCSNSAGVVEVLSGKNCLVSL